MQISTTYASRGPALFKTRQNRILKSRIESQGLRQRFGRVCCRQYEEMRELDADFVEAMHEVQFDHLLDAKRMSKACDRTSDVIGKGDQKGIDALHEEFGSMWMFLMDEKDLDSANFIAVLQGLLQHTIISSVADLKGPYLRSYKQVFNALQGLNWELMHENPEPTSEGPKTSQSNGRPKPQKGTGVDYYEILGVASTADKKDIRTAYRTLALKWHPDVSNQNDAETVFLKIRKAYDVLSDPKSRRLYDLYGAEEMEKMSDAHAGDGNADRFWNEFKPFTKQSRKTKARNAGRERTTNEASSAEPVTGDVVEYPLSDFVKADLQDGREFGVGLLVGRNKDRGDAAKLPPELLDLCEIEPLRQETANSNKWIPDEIGSSAFCNLGSLKRIPVDSYDGRFDVWLINSELSEGCGGPEIVEEIVL